MSWPASMVRRQRGALMISFALMLIVILGFIGLALDMAQLYNRTWPTMRRWRRPVS